MADKHEIRIVAADLSKVINFGENAGAWEDVYSGAGSVIGDEPEQFAEGDVVVGRIETDMEYAEAVEIIIDEALLGKELAAALRSREPNTVFKRNE